MYSRPKPLQIFSPNSARGCFILLVSHGRQSRADDGSITAISLPRVYALSVFSPDGLNTGSRPAGPHWAHSTFFLANMSIVPNSPYTDARVHHKDDTDRYATWRRAIRTSDATMVQFMPRKATIQGPTGIKRLHTLAATASPHRPARRTSAQHHAQRTNYASVKPKVMLKLAAHHAQISWPAKEGPAAQKRQRDCQKVRRCARTQAAFACGKGGAKQGDRTCRAPQWPRRRLTRSRLLQCRPSRRPRYV